MLPEQRRQAKPSTGCLCTDEGYSCDWPRTGCAKLKERRDRLIRTDACPDCGAALVKRRQVFVEVREGAAEMFGPPTTYKASSDVVFCENEHVWFVDGTTNSSPAWMLVPRDLSREEGLKDALLWAGTPEELSTDG